MDSHRFLSYFLQKIVYINTYLIFVGRERGTAHTHIYILYASARFYFRRAPCIKVVIMMRAQGAIKGFMIRFSPATEVGTLPAFPPGGGGGVVAVRADDDDDDDAIGAGDF